MTIEDMVSNKKKNKNLPHRGKNVSFLKKGIPFTNNFVTLLQYMSVFLTLQYSYIFFHIEYVVSIMFVTCKLKIEIF